MKMSSAVPAEEKVPPPRLRCVFDRALARDACRILIPSSVTSIASLEQYLIEEFDLTPSCPHGLTLKVGALLL